jgi:nitrile hydratase accessory protein
VSQTFSAPLAASVEAMDTACAPPRDNGEFVFAEPWEGRAFAMAVLLVEELGVAWSVFQERLIAAIARDPQRPYYENWAAALEALILDFQLVLWGELDAEARRVAGAAHAQPH